MAKIDLKDYLERLEEPEDREAVASREYQKELFEQYVQKGDNFPELRAQLLKEYQDGADLTGPQGLRRKLGAFDLGYFGRAYLPHYFVRPSPPFHEEFDRIFREGVMKGMNPRREANQPGQRMPEGSRGPAWTCQVDELHLQGLHTLGGVRLQALRDHPLGQLGTGGGLPLRHQDRARGERSAP